MKKKLLIVLPFMALPSASIASQEVAGRFRVDFSDRHKSMCSFSGSPVELCSDEFVQAYERALSKPVNFNKTMILVPLDTRPQYAQQALVAIDPLALIVYPLPFDHFAKDFDNAGPHKHGRLTYSIEGSEVCVHGELMSYRSIQSGPMCWNLVDDKFVGDITPYTYPDH